MAQVSAMKEERVAGWGDDEVSAEIRDLMTDGWVPVKVHEDRETAGGPYDVVTMEKAGETKDFSSDHLHFHRFVEGLMDDFGLSYT
jgi:hypothetical protein